MRNSISDNFSVHTVLAGFICSEYRQSFQARAYAVNPLCSYKSTLVQPCGIFIP